MNKQIYRWVEPETVVIENGKEKTIPAHQEEGEYLDEAAIPGYIVVNWQGKKHLVANYDVVGIYS